MSARLRNRAVLLAKGKLLLAWYLDVLYATRLDCDSISDAKVDADYRNQLRTTRTESG